MGFGRGFPGGSDGKDSACNVGDQGSIPGSVRGNTLARHRRIGLYESFFDRKC